MSNPLYAFPATCEQTLRALARYPSRTAFSWPGGSLSYQGATDLIGRMQSVLAKLGFAPGTRVAFLTANRADTWCAGVAAQLSRLAITWLHPLGSLDDQLFQLEDSEAQMLIVDGVTFRDRGGELAAKASGLTTVFTLGPAGYGADLLQAIEAAGSASPQNFARHDDISTLNYTGGTTGKSKGALRYHREYGGFASAILADFEIPETPRYLLHQRWRASGYSGPRRRRAAERRGRRDSVSAAVEHCRETDEPAARDARMWTTNGCGGTVFYVEQDGVANGRRTMQVWLERSPTRVPQFTLNLKNENVEARRKELTDIVASVRWP